MSVRSTVTATFMMVAAEQGRKLYSLTDDLPLLESGLDSLSFAIIVARLEETLDVDPFSASSSLRFPVTFGEFVRAYELAPQLDA